MAIDRQFDHSRVEEYFREDEFRQIPPDELMDFLPTITNQTRDLKRMDTWKKHFMDLDVPFAITTLSKEYRDGNGQNRPGQFTLWKQLRVKEDPKSRWNRKAAERRKRESANRT